jgi:UDP-N-acetylglucosamine 2-epimerase (non-hydrolysing)
LEVVLLNRIKVLSIFGTRPEAIKMAPLVKALENSEQIESLVCVTAQHREMLDQVLEVFEIIPDYDLDIMKERQSITGITTRVLEGLEEVIQDAKADIVLVHGDTTTTFAGALAAFYNKVKIGHVEAGLRTYNKHEPFPEEMNRVLITSLADLHFAPTFKAKENLLREGVNEEIIFVTGNTAIDALKFTLDDAHVFEEAVLNSIDFHNSRVITVTAHRRENLGKPLEEICHAIFHIVEQYSDVEIVYPVHMNPVVRETVNSILGSHPRIHLIDPVNITDMHNLLNKSYMVMTDSGGLQEEVPSMGKPVLVLRNVTERPEGVEAGTLKLAGTNKDTIVRLAKELLDSSEIYNEMAKAANPFGDGNASRRIANAILHYFGLDDC